MIARNCSVHDEEVKYSQSTSLYGTHFTSKDPLSSLQEVQLHPTKKLPGSVVY